MYEICFFGFIIYFCLKNSMYVIFMRYEKLYICVYVIKIVLKGSKFLFFEMKWLE